MSSIKVVLNENAEVLTNVLLDKLRVSVSALLFKDNKVVLLKHNKTGKITLPGGARDKGEMPLPGLLRELYEELNVVNVENVSSPVAENGEFADLHIGYRIETNDVLVNKEPEKHPAIILADVSDLVKYEFTESAEVTLRGFGLLK